MRRDEAIERIGSNADRFRELGVASLYLFGSTARNEAGADSDVDVFVDIREGTSFSLFRTARAQGEAGGCAGGEG
jgi:predicted nucleotidyltransferase